MVQSAPRELFKTGKAGSARGAIGVQKKFYVRDPKGGTDEKASVSCMVFHAAVLDGVSKAAWEAPRWDAHSSCASERDRSLAKLPRTRSENERARFTFRATRAFLSCIQVCFPFFFLPEETGVVSVDSSSSPPSSASRPPSSWATSSTATGTSLRSPPSVSRPSCWNCR